jgi:hypothetical protein
MAAETKNSSKYIILIRTDDHSTMQPATVALISEKVDDKNTIQRYAVTPAQHLNLSQGSQEYVGSGYISTFEFDERERNEQQRHLFFANTDARRYVHFIVIPQEAYREMIILTGRSQIVRDEGESVGRMENSGTMAERPIFDPLHPQLFSTNGIDIELRNTTRVQFEVLLGGNWSEYALCRSYTAATAQRMIDGEQNADGTWQTEPAFDHFSSDRIAHFLLHEVIAIGENLAPGEKTKASTIKGESLEVVEARIIKAKKAFTEACKPFQAAAITALRNALAHIKAHCPEVVSGANFTALSAQVDIAIAEIGKADTCYSSTIRVQSAVERIRNQIMGSSVMIRLTLDANAEAHQLTDAKRVKEIAEFAKRREKADEQTSETEKALKTRAEQMISDVQVMINNLPQEETAAKKQLIQNLTKILQGMRKNTATPNYELYEKAERHLEYYRQGKGIYSLAALSASSAASAASAASSSTPATAHRPELADDAKEVILRRQEAITEIRETVAHVDSRLAACAALPAETRGKITKFKQETLPLMVTHMERAATLAEIEQRLGHARRTLNQYKNLAPADINSSASSSSTTIADSTALSPSPFATTIADAKRKRERDRSKDDPLSGSKGPRAQSLHANDSSNSHISSWVLASSSSQTSPVTLPQPISSSPAVRPLTTSATWPATSARPLAATASSSNTGVAGNSTHSTRRRSRNVASNPSAISGGFNPYTSASLRPSSSSQANFTQLPQSMNSSQLNMLPLSTAASVPFTHLFVPYTAPSAPPLLPMAAHSAADPNNVENDASITLNNFEGNAPKKS